jgi:predicted methyltransferase
MQSIPNALENLLAPEECAQIDQTLLPTRDRFAMRISIYAWRYLQQVSTRIGVPMIDLTPTQIHDALQADPALQTEPGMDEAFVDWFSRLLVSALGSLTKIANQLDTAMEALSFEQIVNWFVEQFNGTP